MFSLAFKKLRGTFGTNYVHVKVTCEIVANTSLVQASLEKSNVSQIGVHGEIKALALGDGTCRRAYLYRAGSYRMALLVSVSFRELFGDRQDRRRQRHLLKPSCFHVVICQYY